MSHYRKIYVELRWVHYKMNANLSFYSYRKKSHRISMDGK